MASPSRPGAASRGASHDTTTQPGRTKSSGQTTTTASGGTSHAAASSSAAPAAPITARAGLRVGPALLMGSG